MVLGVEILRQIDDRMSCLLLVLFDIVAPEREKHRKKIIERECRVFRKSLFQG